MNVERFAADLRELRLRAGKPDYRELADRTHFRRTSLSQALNGSRLPSWDVTRALVRALGGDEREWQQRWAEAAAASVRTSEPADGRQAADPTPADLQAQVPLPAEVPPAVTPPLADDVAPAPGVPTARPPAFSTPLPASRWKSGRWLSTVAVAVVAAVLTAVIVNGGVFDTRRGNRMAATCWQVTADDVRLWDLPKGGVPDPQKWKTGVVFRGTDAHTDPARLLVPLPNGVTRWVTANPDSVSPSDACH